MITFIHLVTVLRADRFRKGDHVLLEKRVSSLSVSNNKVNFIWNIDRHYGLNSLDYCQYQ